MKEIDKMNVGIVFALSFHREREERENNFFRRSIQQ